MHMEFLELKDYPKIKELVKAGDVGNNLQKQNEADREELIRALQKALENVKMLKGLM